jgi:hypothetical protein
MEQFPTRGIDLIHAPPDYSNHMVRNAGRHPVKGNDPGRTWHPLEGRKVGLCQIYMPKDITREIRLHPSGTRVYRLDAEARIVALDVVQA